MSIDAGIKTLRPMKAILSTLEADVKDIQNYIPDRIIPIEDDGTMNRHIRDYIHEFVPAQNGMLTLFPELYTIYRREGEDTSGVTSYLTGQAATGSNKTARGVAQLTQNAEIRNSIMTQVLSIGATQLLEMMHSMNQQFGNPNEDQYGVYNWRVFGNSIADRNQRFQSLQALLPAITAVGGNPVEVLKRLLSDAGIPAIDNILPSDGTLEANQQRDALGQMFAGEQGAQNVQ